MGELVKEMFDYMFQGGLFDQMVKILTANPSDESTIYYSAWKIVMKAYETYIIPLGIGMMIIWFLVAFIQKSTQEQLSFEALFLLFVKLFAAFYLINHGMELFAKFWGFGNSLANNFANLKDAGIPDDALESAWKSLTKKDAYNLPGFWRSLGCFAQLMFPWIVCAILSGVASFIAYSRMIEMLLRIMVAPIALSDFISEGLHGTGWRYIKAYFAICLQGFMILIIAKIYTSILASVLVTGTFMELTVGYLVISFAAVSLMFKSLSLCKELVGA